MNKWTKPWKYHVMAVPIALVIVMIIIRLARGAEVFDRIVWFFPGFFLGWLTAVIAHFVYPEK